MIIIIKYMIANLVGKNVKLVLSIIIVLHVIHNIIDQ